MSDELISEGVLRLMLGDRQVGVVDPAVAVLGREPTFEERLAVGQVRISWVELSQVLADVTSAYQQWDEQRDTQRRRLWSGPDKFDRQILRAYRLPWRALGLVPKSAFSPEYRRRQRARVKRRRR